MNIFDVVIVLLIMLSFINGYRRGVLKEVVILLGTAIIYIVAFSLKGKVGILLCKILPFFYLDGLTSLNILIYQLIGFFLIASILFTIFAIVLNATGVLQKLVDVTIILEIPSKILGGIFGLIEGYIVVFIILITLSVPFKDFNLFNNSYLNNKIITSSPILSSYIGNLDDFIIDVCEIGNTDTSNKKEINEKLLKMYVNYNIVDKKDLDDIIKSGKLNVIKK